MALAAQAGAGVLGGSSLKAALDTDWDDPTARDHALGVVLAALESVEVLVATHPQVPSAASAALAVARQVRDQDVQVAPEGAASLRQGVAKDRRISVEDAHMRHGRKSRSTLVDGYKRHVLTDLDSGLVPAVGITPANAPEATVTDDIAADLAAQDTTLSSSTSTGRTWPPRWCANVARTWPSTARRGGSAMPAGSPRPTFASTSTTDS